MEAERFRGYRQAGVNRVSLGVQSFSDEQLRFLGRLHDVAQAERAIALAREIFPRMSFDLIYARPGQTCEQWDSELRRALALSADHLSLYQLTIEPGTPFFDLRARGKLKIPDPDAAAELYELTMAITAQAGLPAYEISNHAAPGAECAHNLVYWRAEPYLGMGAGAHSFFIGRRMANVDSPTRYVEAVNQSYEERQASGTGRAELRQVAGGEVPDEVTLRADAMILGLRLLDGVRTEDFRARFGVSVDDAFGRALQRHESLGLIERTADRVRLTERGLLLANEVFVDLLPDPD